jgi:hypothetical protein
MTAAAALLAQFEQEAKAAQAAEAELRKSLAEQIARLERRRSHAFRRTRLVRALAEAVPPGLDPEKPEEAWGPQAQAVSEELGWGALSDSYRAILAQLAPVGAAIARRIAAPEAEVNVLPALEAFEAWFEGAHGKPFYVLFDQYVPEVPVVDF